MNTNVAGALGVLALAALTPVALASQVVPQAQPSPRPAVVVQIAGATLYLDAGSDSGVTTGDTLTVRRAVAAPPVGALVVIAATATRSVLAFAGAPFAVTRGDTLFMTPGAAGLAAAAAARVATAPARVRERVVPRVESLTARRVTGAFGVEMWGSHSDVTGLGADPVRTTRDLAIPAVRFRTLVSDATSTLDLNLRVEHRTGPLSVFDRPTRIRLYGARYDRQLGALALTAGRFYSDFDHASGFWDGVSLRVGDRSGSFAGIAAGLEPDRGNEEFSAEVPKAAVFIGTTRSGERSDLSTEVAFHRTFAADYARQRQAVDWSLHLRSGRLSVVQELEASPPTLLGTWGISRYILRGSAAIGGAEVYASAVSDRPPVMDTVWVPLPDRRERISGGVSWQSPKGFFADLNAAINGPRDSTSGFSTGATASFPGLFGAGSLLLSASHFSSGSTSGITASPSVEYRFGPARIRGGYQFFQADGESYSVTTHGVDARYSHSIRSRLDLVVQLTARMGSNVRSTNVFTSVEWRF